MTRVLRALQIGDRLLGVLVIVAFLAFLAHKPAFQLVDDLREPRYRIDHRDTMEIRKTFAPYCAVYNIG